MADVNEDVVNEVVDDDSAEGTKTGTTSGAQDHEYSDVEQKAMAQGWVPEDQYEGTGKWRTAEDFLDRGELFAKIDEEKRRRSALEGTVQELKKHYKKVQETEYKRALANLKAEKVAALNDGDAARVVEIDEAIADTKAEAATAAAEPERQATQQQAQNPAFQIWVNRNSWYTNDRAMKAFADTVGDDLVANGRTNPIEILAEVEKQVKKEFAHRFSNPNRSRPGTVEGGGAKGSQSRDTFQLTAEETRAMNRFVKAGVLTKEQYVKDIKAQRGEG